MSTPETVVAGLSDYGRVTDYAPDNDWALTCEQTLPPEPAPEPLSPVAPTVEHRGKFRKPVLAACLTLAAAALGTPEVAHAGPVLDFPPGNTEQQQVIYHELTQDVREATRGSTIRIDNPTMAWVMERALVADDERGVHVHAVLAGHGPLSDELSPAAKKLVQKLGTDMHHDSFVHICQHACNSNVPNSIMHDKELLISDVHGHPVSWETSVDWTPFQGPREWNNAYATTNKGFYHHKTQWFDSMLDGKRHGFTGHFSIGNLVDYEFPRPTDTARHNVFIQALSPVDCRRNGHSTHTHVDEITSRISPLMATLVKRWGKLEKRGCDVRVIFNKQETPRSLIKLARKDHVPYRFSNETTNGVKRWSHDKVIAIRGEYGGKRLSTVYSGSLNPNIAEIQDCDESWMRVKNSRSVYNAFDKQFNQIWRLGNQKPLPAGQKVIIVR